MSSATATASPLRAGLRDWWEATRNAELWGTLAWYDIVLRYRRSLLGPVWLTISTGALLLGMGPLYAMLLGVPLQKFFPHLTLGIIFWNFISGSLNDGCTAFYTGAQYLKQPGFPPLALVWRSLARNLIQLAHTLVLYLPVALWFRIPFSARALLFLPGLAVLVLNLNAGMITLGLLTARFRDVAQIVASGLSLMLFLTLAGNRSGSPRPPHSARVAGLPCITTLRPSELPPAMQSIQATECSQSPSPSANAASVASRSTVLR
jgi:lipopolysaccharide transport system permease protein